MFKSLDPHYIQCAKSLATELKLHFTPLISACTSQVFIHQNNFTPMNLRQIFHSKSFHRSKI